MSAYQYETIYNALRARIEAGEFPLGDRLPSISALQDEYDVPSLGTVRAAQRMLAEDGMIRTEQGRGAFVTSIESARTIDLEDALDDAVAQIRRAQAALTRQQVRRVTFDLDADDDTYFVLAEALTEFAERAESDAEDDPYNGEDRRRWAGHARKLLEMTEEALERTIEPNPEVVSTLAPAGRHLAELHKFD
ncbi:MAG: winged helix-turn-helix domain-containing protein [Brachybacterium sp.]